MKIIPLCVLVSCALAASAFAKTYSLPDDKPFVSITVPDAWETDEIDNGVESTSKDGEVYFYVEVTDADNVKAAMQEGIKYLQSKGVTLDADSAKDQEGKLNGMDIVGVKWDGKDEEGPAKISLTLIMVTEEKGLLLVYWGSPDGSKANKDELDKIVNSIKKL
jgi:hypothetical protein